MARGYDCGIPDAIADIVRAIDMFFGIKDPTEFLGELKRITKSEGILVLDDGHQSREETPVHSMPRWLENSSMLSLTP